MSSGMNRHSRSYNCESEKQQRGRQKGESSKSAISKCAQIFFTSPFSENHSKGRLYFHCFYPTWYLFLDLRKVFSEIYRWACSIRNLADNCVGSEKKEQNEKRKCPVSLVLKQISTTFSSAAQILPCSGILTADWGKSHSSPKQLPTGEVKFHCKSKLFRTRGKKIKWLRRFSSLVWKKATGNLRSPTDFRSPFFLCYCIWFWYDWLKWPSVEAAYGYPVRAAWLICLLGEPTEFLETGRISASLEQN